ncbi:NADH-dependent alcohol dehydrogenase, partial [Francisella tularensis subsp. holarctica]|nr:NADH-dependent alcohol dehydrogenase [Francisella tularensis subsp. holarctica]
MNAVSKIQAHHIDFNLADARASVIDAVKFISAAVTGDGEPWDKLTQAATINQVMRFGRIVSIAATG